MQILSKVVRGRKHEICKIEADISLWDSASLELSKNSSQLNSKFVSSAKLLVLIVEYQNEMCIIPNHLPFHKKADRLSRYVSLKLNNRPLLYTTQKNFRRVYYWFLNCARVVIWSEIFFSNKKNQVYIHSNKR